jgi:hypothetical protein
VNCSTLVCDTQVDAVCASNSGWYCSWSSNGTNVGNRMLPIAMLLALGAAVSLLPAPCVLLSESKH